MPDRRRAENSSLTPYEREERARAAARARWDRNPYDRDLATQPARDGLRQKFLDQVDPEGRLEPYIRERRADEAERRYFQDLANRPRRKQ